MRAPSYDPRVTAPSTQPPALTPARRNQLLLVLLAPLFMALVAVSVLNVALNAIGHSLGASSEGLQWVLSGYALAFGLVLVPAGRLGDATGRRRVLLIGVAVFTVGSLASGLAPTVHALNAARIVQGIGAGLFNPQIVGILQRHFRGQSRAKAFALLATTVAVATAVGPVIGGLLIQLLGEDSGWRWMFFMNVPIGLAALALGPRWVPDDHRRDRSRRLDMDPVGIVLLALAVLAIMLPFLERGAGHLIWLCLPAGLLVLLGWAAWESRYARRGGEPMVDLDIFASPAFRNGILIVSVYFLGSTSIWIIVPLLLQAHLHHTAFEASLLGLPSSVGAMISSQVGGRYVLRLGRRLVIAGFIVVLVALGAVTLTAAVVEAGAAPFWVLAIPLALVGVSQGMIISPNQTLTLGAVDSRYGGVAGGILQLGQRMGQAIGTALIPGILFSIVDTGGDWLHGFTMAMVAIMAMTVMALGVSIVDRAREKAVGTLA